MDDDDEDDKKDADALRVQLAALQAKVEELTRLQADAKGGSAKT
ncbi:MAG: hypothetical protein ACRDY7_02310 [Acidimicrobiia bacterium]